MRKRYEVQTYTLADGWVNCWNEDGQPVTFESEAAAAEALDEFFYELADAPADMANSYSADDYRIVEVTR